MQNKHLLAALSAALLALPGIGFAADEPPADPWQFGVSVPLWAPRVDGTSTVLGHHRDVDISFSDLKDKLDASFALGLEVRKQKFGFFGGVGYMKFSLDGANASDELKIYIVDAGGFYRFLQMGEEHPFVLEATAGIRYWRTENELTLRAPGGGLDFNGSKDRDLVDPMIGLRGSKFLTQKLHLDFAADIGGFDLSDDQSTLDWSATGLVTYDFAKWFSLSGGYKALALNASQGTGGNESGLDIIMNGFLIVAKFKF